VCKYIVLFSSFCVACFFFPFLFLAKGTTHSILSSIFEMLLSFPITLSFLSLESLKTFGILLEGISFLM